LSKCIVGVGYRLSPKTIAPKYIEDAAAVTAWGFNNINKYGGDGNLIFVSEKKGIKKIYLL